MRTRTFGGAAVLTPYALAVILFRTKDAGKNKDVRPGPAREKENRRKKKT